MTFCGQCGSQLAPGITHCPRCGATVDEGNIPADEMPSDGATMASLHTRNPGGLSQPSPPPLVLPPANRNDYGTQAAYDATSRMEAPGYGTQQVPPNPNMGSTYANSYPQQSGQSYPTQASYSDFTNRGPGTYAGGYPMNTQQAFQQPYTQGTNKVRVTALVLVMLGVLFLLIAIILLVLQNTHAIAETIPTSTPNTITATITLYSSGWVPPHDVPLWPIPLK